jgi:hypothetical protein
VVAAAVVEEEAVVAVAVAVEGAEVEITSNNTDIPSMKSSITFANQNNDAQNH